MMVKKEFYVHKGKIRQTSDCAVLALSNYFNFSYEEAVKYLQTDDDYNYGQPCSMITLILAIWEITNRQPIFQNLIGKNFYVTDIDFDCFLIFEKHVGVVKAQKKYNIKNYENTPIKYLIIV